MAAVGALAAALGLSAAPAEGTFPGRNGQIVFEQYREDTGEQQIAIMGPTGSNPAPADHGRRVLAGDLAGRQAGGLHGFPVVRRQMRRVVSGDHGK